MCLNFFDDTKDILEEVYDDGDDIFEKVSDDVKDILEKLSDDGNDIFVKVFDIEIEFELTLLTYKVFSCKDVRSKFLGVRLLAVQSNTQSRS